MERYTLQQRIEISRMVKKKIIMSDEAHFHLGAYFNKQNCRIWSSENLKMIIEQPLYPQRVTVWCGFWAGGIIGPYFFENEAGAAVSVNGWRYRTMINEFLWPQFDDMDVNDVYFQQDGTRVTQVEKPSVLCVKSSQAE